MTPRLPVRSEVRVGTYSHIVGCITWPIMAHNNVTQMTSETEQLIAYQAGLCTEDKAIQGRKSRTQA
jgi:hypothetical protein